MKTKDKRYFIAGVLDRIGGVRMFADKPTAVTHAQYLANRDGCQKWVQPIDKSCLIRVAPEYDES